MNPSTFSRRRSFSTYSNGNTLVYTEPIILAYITTDSLGAPHLIATITCAVVNVDVIFESDLHLCIIVDLQLAEFIQETMLFIEEDALSALKDQRHV